MNQIIPKELLLPENATAYKEKNLDNRDFQAAVEAVNRALKSGVDFGEANIRLTQQNSDGKQLFQQIEEMLVEAGYKIEDKKYNYFDVDYSTPWASISFTIPLGEKVIFHCTNCKAVLNNDDFLQSAYQFNNALWLGFFGGYGMFIDGEFDRDPNMMLKKAGAELEAVLCHDCAHKLCELFPGIGEIIDPTRSHSHTEEYHKTNPDHFGWDYGDESNESK